MTEKKKTVLIVEDEQPQVTALMDELTDNGFNVLRAVNGQDGLEIALRDKPDLILLDIVMPIMDGMTMLKQLRKENDWGKSVPVILLTNLSADNDERMWDIAATEPAYYLVKSNWSLHDVMEKIRERLSQSE